MTDAPWHVEREHPIRQMLESAARGSAPTRSQLDALKRGDLPEGSDLARFRNEVATAAAEIAAIRGQGNGQAARARCDEVVQGIATRMTDEERSVRGEEHPEDLAEIGRRIFER